MEWKAMPFWTRYYCLDEKKAEILALIRKDAGEDYETFLVETGYRALKRVIHILTGMREVLEAIDCGEIDSQTRDILETAVVHEFIIDRIRDVLTASLYEAFGDDLRNQPEEQLILTVVFAMVQQADGILNSMLIEEPKRVALETFVKLVGEEGIQEARVGGPDFIFHQCVGEIVLRDESLHSFMRSRLPINFTY